MGLALKGLTESLIFTAVKIGLPQHWNMISNVIFTCCVNQIAKRVTNCEVMQNNSNAITTSIRRNRERYTDEIILFILYQKEVLDTVWIHIKRGICSFR